MARQQVALTEPTSVYVAAGNAINCARCGVVFWLTKQLEDALRMDHRTFYCPVGHTNFYPQETDAEKYKRLYRTAEDRLAATRAERDQIEASRRAWKGQATKARKQAVQGLCPLCGQSVYQLKRHMTRQHPDAATSDA